MKVLFVCNQNENRSKTAAELFADKFETESAGLYSEHPLNEEQLEQSDLIVVMEESQRSEIAKRFPKQYMMKKIISFNIPDIYKYKQDKLLEILNSKEL